MRNICLVSQYALHAICSRRRHVLTNLQHRLKCCGLKMPALGTQAFEKQHLSSAIEKSLYHDSPLPLPRTPMPLPMPLVVLPGATPPLDVPLVPPCPPTPTYPLPALPADVPLPLALGPLTLPFTSAASLRLFSSSSAFLAAASRLCDSSTSFLSFSCCRSRFSFSASAISCVAPCHEGLRIRRWLCSVWERMRVHVWSNVEALDTVRETDYQAVDVSSESYGEVPGRPNQLRRARIHPCCPSPSPDCQQHPLSPY